MLEILYWKYSRYFSAPIKKYKMKLLCNNLGFLYNVTLLWISSVQQWAQKVTHAPTQETITLFHLWHPAELIQPVTQTGVGESKLRKTRDKGFLASQNRSLLPRRGSNFCLCEHSPNNISRSQDFLNFPIDSEGLKQIWVYLLVALKSFSSNGYDLTIGAKQCFV